MKKKRKFSFLILIVIMDVLITGLSLVMGCLTYSSNTKKIQQNDASIRLTNLTGNIRYALSFIGEIEKYYGLHGALVDAKEEMPRFQDLYVLDRDGNVISATSDEELSLRVKRMTPGTNRVQGRQFICVFSLTDGANLVSVEDASPIFEKEQSYFPKLILIAVIGFLATGAIMSIFWVLVKKEKPRRAILILILGAWVMLFGAFVGVTSAKDYSNSLTTLNGIIEEAFEQDIATLQEEGVPISSISDFDSYLSRYTENIPEIEKIVYKNDGLVFTRSDNYIRSVYLDYALQTLLSLMFTGMILAEYTIFLAKTREEEGKEEQDAA